MNAKDKDVKTKPSKPPRRGRSLKNKGDNFERELAAHINQRTGLGSGRAPLSGGGKVGLSGGADLLGTPDLFVEAKRTERLNIREAMAQAETNIRKTQSPEAPIVITRRNRESIGDSLACMRLDAFLAIYRSHLILTGVIKPETPAPDPAQGRLEF